MVAETTSDVNSTTKEARITGALLTRSGSRDAVKLWLADGYVFVADKPTVNALKTQFGLTRQGQSYEIRGSYTAEYALKGHRRDLIAWREGKPKNAYIVGTTGEARVTAYTSRASAGDGGKVELLVEGEFLIVPLGLREGTELLASVGIEVVPASGATVMDKRVMVSYLREQRSLKLISLWNAEEAQQQPTIVAAAATSEATAATSAAVVTAPILLLEAVPLVCCPRPETRRERATRLAAGLTLTSSTPIILPLPPALDDTTERLPIMPSEITIHRAAARPVPQRVHHAAIEVTTAPTTAAEDEPGEDFYRHSSMHWQRIPRGIRHREVMAPLDQFVDLIIDYVDGKRTLGDLRAKYTQLEGALTKAKGKVTQERNRLQTPATLPVPATVNPLQMANRERAIRIEAGYTRQYAEDGARLKQMVKDWLGIDIEPTSASYSGGVDQPTFSLSRFGEEYSLRISMYVPVGVGRSISRSAQGQQEASAALRAVQTEYDLAVEAMERNLNSRETKHLRQQFNHQ